MPFLVTDLKITKRVFRGITKEMKSPLQKQCRNLYSSCQRPLGYINTISHYTSPKLGPVLFS